MTIRFALFTLIFNLMFSAALSNTYSQAQQAFNNGDYARAAEIYRNLSQNGDKYSSYALADMYLDGTGVEKDTDAGISLLKRSINDGMNSFGLGHPFVTLGWIYQTGEYYGVSQNPDLALFWNKFGAHYGHPAGYDNLAQIYANGLGVAKNNEKMMNYLLGALENYDPDYSYLLAEPDEWLTYVTSNDPLVWKARAIFRDAMKTGEKADKDRLLAMKNDLTIGPNPALSYSPQGNHAEVVNIFESALSGSGDAQFKLGAAFENGSGLIQNNVYAHMWYNIARFNGDQNAHQNLHNLSQRMTIESVEEAQNLAIRCLHSNYLECGWVISKQHNSGNLENKISLSANEVIELKNYFFQLSPTKRKQIQYALKFFGLYKAKIDGLWGAKTVSGLQMFQKIQFMPYVSPKDFFHDITWQVSVPSTFSDEAQRPQNGFTAEGRNTLSSAEIELLRVQREMVDAYRRAAEARAQQQAADRLMDFGMQLAFPNRY